MRKMRNVRSPHEEEPNAAVRGAAAVGLSL
eukprot:SAG11_NODE_2193_length_3702_cov_6.080242_1_plen_29_part_10